MEQNISDHTIDMQPPLEQEVSQGINPVVDKKALIMILFSVVTLVTILFVFLYSKKVNNNPIMSINKNVQTEVRQVDATPVTPSIMATGEDSEVSDLIAKGKSLGQKLNESKTIHTENPTEEDNKNMEEMTEVSKKLRALDKNAINSVLSITAYDYDITVTINGKDVGTKGGGSVSTRYMYQDSLMAELATEEVRNNNFVLKKGENIVVMTYKKKKEESHLTANFKIVQENGELIEVFDVIAEKKNEGVITLKFVLPITENTKLIEISE